MEFIVNIVPEVHEIWSGKDTCNLHFNLLTLLPPSVPTAHIGYHLLHVSSMVYVEVHAFPYSNTTIHKDKSRLNNGNFLGAILWLNLPYYFPVFCIYSILNFPVLTIASTILSIFHSGNATLSTMLSYFNVYTNICVYAK